MNALTLTPPRAVRGRVEPPGSKSIANRVLPLAALAAGTTRLGNLPGGEDVELMRGALEQLGVPMLSDGGALEIRGLGGPFRARDPQSLFLGNSGTSMRILAALLAAGQGEFL